MDKVLNYRKAPKTTGWARWYGPVSLICIFLSFTLIIMFADGILYVNDTAYNGYDLEIVDKHISIIPQIVIAVLFMASSVLGILSLRSGAKVWAIMVFGLMILPFLAIICYVIENYFISQLM